VFFLSAVSRKLVHRYPAYTYITQVYIVLAQTFGWYKTCDCVTSTWGGEGGYLDFSLQDTSNSQWVMYYWTAGSCVTGTVLLLSMFYITVEVSFSHILCGHRSD
jgi:hypothetical protein